MFPIIKQEIFDDVNDKTEWKTNHCEKCFVVRKSFGDPVKLVAKYCRKCAPENYVHVYKKKCIKCNIKASYGLLSDKIMIVCNQHRDKNIHKDLTRICRYKDCPNKAEYADVLTMRRRRCFEHKLQYDLIPPVIERLSPEEWQKIKKRRV